MFILFSSRTYAKKGSIFKHTQEVFSVYIVHKVRWTSDLYNTLLKDAYI